MSDIEKEFFEAFGVEPLHAECRAEIDKDYKCNKSNWDDANCPCGHEYYPPITSDIVLGLSEIIWKYYNKKIPSKNMDSWKNTIIILAISISSDIKNQVKALFKC